MDETIKVVLEIDKETFNRIKGYVEIDHFEHDIVGYTMKRLAGGTILNEVEAEDCINREEVLKLMKDNWHNHNGDWAMQESMDDIRALPSIYPKSDKPIRSHWHGHWIDCDKNDDYSADGYDCSVCGVNAEYATSYCPNCGAKMIERQESENI